MSRKPKRRAFRPKPKQHDVGASGWYVITLWAGTTFFAGGTLLVTVLVGRTKHLEIPLFWIAFCVLMVVMSIGYTISWILRKWTG